MREIDIFHHNNGENTYIPAEHRVIKPPKEWDSSPTEYNNNSACRFFYLRYSPEIEFLFNSNTSIRMIRGNLESIGRCISQMVIERDTLLLGRAHHEVHNRAFEDRIKELDQKIEELRRIYELTDRFPLELLTAVNLS